jgi:hypothetical protein
MSLLQNSNAIPAAGATGFYEYQIAKSCKFVSGSSSYLTRTPSGAPSSDKICTISFWYKNAGQSDSNMYYFTAYSSDSSVAGIYRYPQAGAATDHQIRAFSVGDTSVVQTSNQFRDFSAWGHLVLRIDTTQSTNTDRVRWYHNGVLVDISSSGLHYPDQNETTVWNGQVAHLIGGYKSSQVLPYDGYFAEFIMADGQSYAPTQFGESKNGVWIPKDPSGTTFGNNGFHLDFADSSALGNDVSGNNNDFSASGLGTDHQMLDTPTFNSSSNGGNFCTLNPLAKGSYATLSEGNLRASGSSADGSYIPSTMAFKTGKWYCEFLCVSRLEGWPYVSIFDYANQAYSATTGSTYAIRYQADDDLESNTGDPISSFGTITLDATGLTTYTDDDIIGIHLDCDNKKVWFSKNGSFFNSGDPSAGTNPQATWTGTPTIAFMGAAYQDYDYIMNFGQSSNFAGTKTSGSANASDENGYGDFYYAPDTGFLAMCAGNLPVADAVDPAQTDDNYPQKLFGATIWTGDGTTSRAITGLGFQPDWVWFKARSSAFSNRIYDTSRGINSNGGKRLFSNTDGAETDQTSGQDISAVGSDGFTLGASSNLYTNDTNSGGLHVAWTWRANGGTETTNNTGTQTSYTQTDPSGAFSIVRYAGTGSAMTVGHGLSVEPKLTIVKDRDATIDWIVYTKVIDGSLDYFFLNVHDAVADSGLTGPNTSIWNFNSASSYSNTSGRNYIMYNFADIEGYCKVGTYVGNANADGTFCYTGFKPEFFMCKPIVTGNWRIQDIKRSPHNVANKTLYPNHSNAEESYSSDSIDVLSNGVKMRASDSNYNQATTFVYLAMAHNPFKYATAR